MKNASMSSTPDEITKIKQQNEKSKEMHLLKQKYRKDEIYIYECWNCQNPLMLHQEKCPVCKSSNDYFDRGLKVAADKNDAVLKDLSKFSKEIPPLKLTTQKEQGTESLTQERQSLKSARRSRNEPEAEEPKKVVVEQEQQVMIWICDVCKRPNDFSQGANCQHVKDNKPCEGNLEMMENFETKEMKISEYKADLEKWEQVMKEEDNKLSENDWKCEECDTINQMNNNDIYSAYCKKCNRKNEWIEHMIKLANNNQAAKQTELEMDFYKRNKNGEMDRQ